MHLRDEFDLDDFIDEDEDEEMGEGLLYRLRHLLVVVAAIGAFVWLAYYAYHSGTQPQSLDEIPLIKAEDESLRKKPEDPGGMEIPHQDKTVYGLLEKDQQPSEEKILPLPEEPIDDMDNAIQDDAKTSPRRLAQVEEIIGGREEKEEVSAPVTVKSHPVIETAKSEPEKKAEEKPAAAPAPAVIAQKKEVKPAPTEPKKIVADASSAKETAALAPAAANFKYRAQLGAFRSKDDAGNAWEKISQSQKDLLKPYGHTVEWVDLKEKGVFYRLQVTGIASEAEVRKLCNALSARKQGCMLVK